MTSLPSPEWIRLPRPDLAHHAFEAWSHTDSGCLLVRLWYPCDEVGAAAGSGNWFYEVRHPDGRRKLAYVAWGAPSGAVPRPLAESFVLSSAAAVVRELVGAVQPR